VTEEVSKSASLPPPFKSFAFDCMKVGTKQIVVLVNRFRAQADLDRAPGPRCQDERPRHQPR
jgi:hypothetical protein